MLVLGDIYLTCILHNVMRLQFETCSKCDIHQKGTSNDFALKFCVCRAGAKKVYACEWNPNAIVALRHNLQVNRVESRCSVIEGDNRLTTPQVCYLILCIRVLFADSVHSWHLWKVRITVTQTLHSFEDL